MSEQSIEVIDFIGANERHLEACSSRKAGKHLAEGDIVRVPGVELHDDLAGLSFSFSIDTPPSRQDGQVSIRDAKGNKIWFTDAESVRIEPGTYADLS